MVRTARCVRLPALLCDPGSECFGTAPMKCSRQPTAVFSAATFSVPKLETWLVKFLFTSLHKAWQVLDAGGHMAIHITDLFKKKVGFSPTFHAVELVH